MKFRIIDPSLLTIIVAVAPVPVLAAQAVPVPPPVVVVVPPSPPRPPITPIPSPVVAVPAPPPPAVPAAQQATAEQAMAFAESYAPGDMVRTAGLELTGRGFDMSAKEDPTLPALQAKFPGLTEVARAVTLRVANKMYDRSIPLTHERVAAIARAYIPAPELTALTAFYRSPTGIKFLQSVGSTIDTSAIEQKLKADPDNFALKPNDVRGMITAKYVDRLTSAELADVMQVMASPAGLKLRSVTPLLLEAVTMTTNEGVASAKSELATEVPQAVAAFVRNFATKTKP